MSKKKRKRGGGTLLPGEEDVCGEEIKALSPEESRPNGGGTRLAPQETSWESAAGGKKTLAYLAEILYPSNEEGGLFRHPFQGGDEAGPVRGRRIPRFGKYRRTSWITLEMGHRFRGVITKGGRPPGNKRELTIETAPETPQFKKKHQKKALSRGKTIIAF